MQWNFQKITTFWKKAFLPWWGGFNIFSDWSCTFVCSWWSFLYLTLWVHNFILGLLEVEKECQSEKVAMLKKLWLVKLIKSGIIKVGKHWKWTFIGSIRGRAFHWLFICKDWLNFCCHFWLIWHGFPKINNLKGSPFG